VVDWPAQVARLVILVGAGVIGAAVALLAAAGRLGERARADEVRALSGEVRRQVAERARNLAASLMQLPDSPSSVPRVMAGDVIDGRYKILRPLGQGGMGVVYEVERVHDGGRLALKLMLGLAHRAALARFAREAQVAAQLDHPNVVATVDLGVTDTGALFLVMELVRGSTLQAERVRYGEGAWGVPVLLQVARALAAMHGAGIVHRDLKPSNVLLEGALVKVGDFGIAALLDDGPEATGLTRTGVLAGTPPYMAPELARGIREATPAADIFSLGVLCFEVLARRLPYAVPPVLEAQFGHSPSAPEPVEHAVPTIPKPLAQLIDACLQVDPASRPSARAAMATLESVSKVMPPASLKTTEAVSTSERQTLTFDPRLKEG
jgi:serine/threonine-protein kinase